MRNTKTPILDTKTKRANTNVRKFIDRRAMEASQRVAEMFRDARLELLNREIQK